MDAKKEAQDLVVRLVNWLQYSGAKSIVTDKDREELTRNWPFKGTRAYANHIVQQAIEAACAEAVEKERERCKELEQALRQTDHFIVLDDNGWSIEHLVSCRADGMTNCLYHREAARLFADKFVEQRGRYKMYVDEGQKVHIDFAHPLVQQGPSAPGE